MELIGLEDWRENFLYILPPEFAVAASGPGDVDGFVDLGLLDGLQQFSRRLLDEI